MYVFSYHQQNSYKNRIISLNLQKVKKNEGQKIEHVFFERGANVENRTI